jgi:DNA-binding NarL/FixJ family response regulator
MQPITIAIIEDLKKVASELADMLESAGFSCSQIYSNAEDAMLFLPRNPVDIVIVDIGLPHKSGIEAISFIKTQCPQTQFCMFTVFEDDDKIFRSLEAGAKGYILKGTSPQKIVDSILELNEGGSPMSPTIARRILEVFKPPVIEKSNEGIGNLSARENELLQLLAKGLYYKEIADKLGITTGTVKQHIHKIYDKLHVQNRTEAINKLRGI